jgi:outer membrane protein OmpA-like peptidoglycan-associated protein
LTPPAGTDVTFYYETIGVTKGIGDDVSVSGSAEFMPSDGTLYIADSFSDPELAASDIEGYCIVDDATGVLHSASGGSLTMMILGIPASSVPSEIVKTQGALGIGAELFSRYHVLAGALGGAILDAAPGDWLADLLTTNAKALLITKGQTASTSPTLGVSATLGVVSRSPSPRQAIDVPIFEPPLKRVDELDIRSSYNAVSIKLPNNALFDFGSAKLKPQAVPVLVAASVQIAGRRSWNIKVEGHTDSVGGRKFNKILSEKRAQAVADWLIKNMSVRAGQVLPIGRGMDRPIAPNQTKNGRDNPVGRRLNRRVEITLYP